MRSAVGLFAAVGHEPANENLEALERTAVAVCSLVKKQRSFARLKFLRDLLLLLRGNSGAALRRRLARLFRLRALALLRFFFLLVFMF